MRNIVLLIFMLSSMNNLNAQCTSQLISQGNNQPYNIKIGQSFQMSCDGILNTIVFTPTESFIDVFGSSDGVSVGLRLRDASNTIIANGLIGGQSAANTWGPNNTYTFNFSSSNVNLVANTTYSWELYCIENIQLILLGTSNTNPYANGNAIFDGASNSTQDIHGWTVNVSAPLSSDSFQKEQFKVYPNPSNGLFSIENDNITKIEIFDLVGKMVWNSQDGSNMNIIDLSNLPLGIYLAKISNIENQTSTIKLIKE